MLCKQMINIRAKKIKFQLALQTSCLAQSLFLLCKSWAQIRCQTFHEPNIFKLGLTQIIKRVPVISDIELNLPNLI